MRIFKSKKCTNGGFEHNFQPRFSYIPVSLKDTLKTLRENLNAGSFSMYELAEFVKEISGKQYECDVCTWCGKVINCKNEKNPKD